VLILLHTTDDDRDDDVRRLILKHEKCRNGPTADKHLLFHRPTQSFREAPVTPKPGSKAAKQAASQAFDDWLQQTDVAADAEGG
jgi:hypothetical protein